MDEKAVYSRLDEIFRDVFRRGDIELGPKLTARDVRGWDSFKQVAILIAAEKSFGIKFASEDVDDLPNVGAFVRVIVRKTQAPA